MLVHDQEVTALERVRDLASDHLVREFLGRVGVLLVESRLGQHLGGEPYEPAIIGFAVQDGGRRVLLADVGQIEEPSVAVCHVGQEGATRWRQARYGLASVGE